MRTNKMLAWLSDHGVPNKVLMLLWGGIGLLLGTGSAVVSGLLVHYCGSPWWMLTPMMLVLMWAIAMTYYVKTIEFVSHLVLPPKPEHQW